MLIKEIQTKLDSFQLYSIFKDKKNSFFLDSGMDYDKLGKYSFIGFDPIEIIKSKNDNIEIKKDGKTEKFKGDPFEALRKIINKYKMDYNTDIPFIGGLVGYLSYDLCHFVEDLPRTAIDDVDIPDMYFGVYDGIIAIDHRNEKVYIAILGVKNDEEELFNYIYGEIKSAEEKGLDIEIKYRDDKEDMEFKSNFETEEKYRESIEKVRSYIKSGDIYQANLTQRFECDLDIEPYDLYAKLRHINPAPFASFLDIDDLKIVSSSPERFIKIKDGIIETRPIKGTINRGSTKEDDEKNREILINSKKDQAELLMIVDLERNDLGKIAKTGTVDVTELFHLEEYSTVYHLVSTVVAEIDKKNDIVDCLKATFPGGSITGAPKIRAMEIIDELEPTQRNIYTGSIGYIGFNEDIDLNIVIRTIVCKNDKAYFQVGGGITWDSDPKLEYEETLHKAKALMDSLNK
ncbi:MAG: aminodeoxychorismate synthase component I [Andreesenia angusta]|nr:aminodeoxychorismate synthase component I [Andreesenia angusta]